MYPPIERVVAFCPPFFSYSEFLNNLRPCQRQQTAAERLGGIDAARKRFSNHPGVLQHHFFNPVTIICCSSLYHPARVGNILNYPCRNSRHTEDSSSSPVSKMFFRCSVMVLRPLPNSTPINFCVSQSVSSASRTSIELSPACLVNT